MYRPIKPLPQKAYDTMKRKLKRHPIIHCFLHHTYCRLVLNFNPASYNHFKYEG